MKRIGILIMGFGLCGTLFPAEIDSLITQLGAERLHTRRDAQRRLEQLAEAAPRQMIVQLAEAYSQEEDLEAEARLETLLAQLAREWMFYHPPGFVGINFRMMALSNEKKAIEVLQVIPDGAAEAAGIRANDRILEFNGTDINDMADQDAFAESIAILQPGSLVEVVVSRKGVKARIRFPLGRRSVEYINIQEASRQEEEKIRDWLISLKKESGRDPDEPMGHFEAAGPESRVSESIDGGDSAYE